MTTPARDTLGRNLGGYVDPPWMAAARETLTLGQLRLLLEPYPGELDVEFRGCGLDGQVPLDIDSWRGVYADLALEPGPGVCTVDHLRVLLSRGVNESFQGYKGGTYWMDYSTPVWVDEYGDWTPDRGITAVRPLIRRGQPAAALIIVTDHTQDAES